MNIDIIINKYLLKSKKQLSASRKNNHIDNNRIALIVLLGVGLIEYILCLLLLKDILSGALSGLALFLTALFIVYYASKDEELEKDYNILSEEYETKMRILIDLLESSNIDINTKSIKALIKAANENKEKYNYILPFKRLLKAGISATTVVVPVLVKVTKFEISSEYFITLLTWFLIGMVVALSIYYSVITSVDKHIRKRYFFHEDFITDLNQLILFKEYYNKKDEKAGLPFVKKIKEKLLVEKDTLLNIYSGHKSEYSENMKTIVGELIRQEGYNPNFDSYNIDYTGWKKEPYDVKNNTMMFNWMFGYAINHEKESAKWTEKLLELSFIKSQVKIVIGYVANDARDKEIETIESQLANFEYPVQDNEEYYVVLMNLKIVDKLALDPFDIRIYSIEGEKVNRL